MLAALRQGVRLDLPPQAAIPGHFPRWVVRTLSSGGGALLCPRKPQSQVPFPARYRRRRPPGLPCPQTPSDQTAGCRLYPGLPRDIPVSGNFRSAQSPLSRGAHASSFHPRGAAPANSRNVPPARFVRQPVLSPQPPVAPPSPPTVLLSPFPPI